MKPELILAVDVPDSARIPPILDVMPDTLSYYKVGLELYASEGPAALVPFLERNLSIFLDLKFHDIPRTTARAVSSAAKHNVAMLTIHASGGPAMISAAKDAAMQASHAPKIIAVTTLTSLDQADLSLIGVRRDLKEQTLALAKLALDSGADGLVCSPHEASSFREALGPDPLLITPGIRPAGTDVGDQKRVATPEMAVRAGSNFLVVGRPILGSPDPSASARAISQQIEDAVSVMKDASPSCRTKRCKRMYLGTTQVYSSPAIAR